MWQTTSNCAKVVFVAQGERRGDVAFLHEVVFIHRDGLIDHWL